MFKLLLIGVGGGFGSVMRYLVGGWVHRLSGGTFPVGTLVINVTGCLVIGLLSGLFAGPGQIRPEYRAAIMIGILGGFTTFSTFGWETFAMANDGQFWRATANVLLSVGLGLIAVWVGYRLVERV
jgi:fluoride exporter